MKVKSAATGVLVAGMALASSALTLGPARGAAWIGQPLALTVTVQLDAGQDANALCAQADVFHADSQQYAAQVKVLAKPGVQPETATLQVLSSAPVDEPVVTVYLRVGCTAASSRRYVLMADYPSEGVVVAPRVVARATPALIHPASQEADAKPAANTRALAMPDPASVPASQKTKPKAPPKPKPKAASSEVGGSQAKAPAAAASVAGRPRLQLDPQGSFDLRITPRELDPQTLAQPQGESRDTQLMRQLQAEMKVLSDRAVKNEVTLLDLRTQLLKAEAQRTPAALLYGLVALVLLSLVAMAVLWNRRKEASGWRSGLADESGPSQSFMHSEMSAQEASPTYSKPVPPPPVVKVEPEVKPEPQPVAGVPPPEPAKAILVNKELDLNLAEMDDESFKKLLSYDWDQPAVHEADKPTGKS